GFAVHDVLINRLSSMYNVLFVVAAGNEGPGRQTVTRPSTASSALSVGATASIENIRRLYQWPAVSDVGDFVLFFSGRGPTASGGFKPNLVAPGSSLSSVPLNSSDNIRAGLGTKWGTSMATPVAAGAYALFLDAIRKYNSVHPDKAFPTEA